jgi:hypothetical protein
LLLYASGSKILPQVIEQNEDRGTDTVALRQLKYLVPNAVKFG